MKLRVELLALLLATSACSGGKVAIGADSLETGGTSGTGSGSGGNGGSSGAGTGGSSGSAGNGSDGGPGGSGAGVGGESGSPGAGGASGGSGAGGAGGNPPDTCNLPLDSGPCFADMPRWGFNPAAGRCIPFTYGGCQGNANNFASEAECTSACSGPCAPQDAEAQGGCMGWFGFKWNGTECVALVGCNCIGSDCRTPITAVSLEECVNTHASCPGAKRCVLERSALEGFVNDNKECAVTEDCQIAEGACGISEDGCTGAIYVNKRAPLAELAVLRSALQACLGEECGGGSCERAPTPVVCSSGNSCWRAGTE